MDANGRASSAAPSHANKRIDPLTSSFCVCRLSPAVPRQHSENEAARRNRLRDRFLTLSALLDTELDDDAGGSGNSRVQVLQAAITAIKESRARIATLEATVAQLHAQLAGGAANPLALSLSMPTSPMPMPMQDPQMHQMPPVNMFRMMATDSVSNGSPTSHLHAAAAAAQQQHIAMQQLLTLSPLLGTPMISPPVSPMFPSPNMYTNAALSVIAAQQAQLSALTSMQSPMPSPTPSSLSVPSPHAQSRSMSAASINGADNLTSGAVSPTPSSISTASMSTSISSSLAPPSSPRAKKRASTDRFLAPPSVSRSSSGEFSVDATGIAQMAIGRGSSVYASSSMNGATSMGNLAVPEVKRRRTGEGGGSANSSTSPSPCVSAQPSPMIRPRDAFVSLSRAGSLSSTSSDASPQLPPLLASQACCLLSLDGQVLEASAPFLSLLSCAREQVVQQSFFSLLHPSDTMGTLHSIQTLLRIGGATSSTDEYTGVEDGRRLFLRGGGAYTANGSSVPLRLVMFVVSDRSGSGRLHMLLAVVVPWDSPPTAPNGFPHGSAACIDTIAAQCGHWLEDHQQKYLVTVLYGVPRTRLVAPPLVRAHSATHSSRTLTPPAPAPHSLSPPIMRLSLSHQHLLSMTQAAVHRRGTAPAWHAPPTDSRATMDDASASREEEEERPVIEVTVEHHHHPHEQRYQPLQLHHTPPSPSPRHPLPAPQPPSSHQPLPPSYHRRPSPPPTLQILHPPSYDTSSPTSAVASHADDDQLHYRDLEQLQHRLVLQATVPHATFHPTAAETSTQHDPQLSTHAYPDPDNSHAAQTPFSPSLFPAQSMTTTGEAHLQLHLPNTHFDEFDRPTHEFDRSSHEDVAHRRFDTPDGSHFSSLAHHAGEPFKEVGGDAEADSPRRDHAPSRRQCIDDLNAEAERAFTG